MTYKTAFSKIIPGICFGLLIVASCSKDRTQTKSLNDYKSPNDYLNSKKQAEQDYTIDSLGKCPLIGKLGTRICPTKGDIQYPNKLDSIHFPFHVKLVELYSAKNMIYYQMPSVGGGNILTTAGEVRIRAFKDTTELVLRTSRSWSVSMPGKNTIADMKQYYGSTTASLTDWITNPVGSFTKNDTSYYAEDQKLGWLACNKDASTSNQVSLSFTSNTDILTNVAIFIYIPSLKSIMQVYNMNSGKIPQGSSIKIIAIAQGESSKLYYFYKEMTLGQNNEIVDVTLQSTTDDELTAKLDAL